VSPRIHRRTRRKAAPLSSERSLVDSHAAVHTEGQGERRPNVAEFRAAGATPRLPLRGASRKLAWVWGFEGFGIDFTSQSAGSVSNAPGLYSPILDYVTTTYTNVHLTLPLMSFAGVHGLHDA